MAHHMRGKKKSSPTPWEPVIAYSIKGRGTLPPSRDTARQGQELASSPDQGCPTVACATTMHTPGCLMDRGRCAWCLPGPSAPDPSLEFKEATGRHCDSRATVWGWAVAQWPEHSPRVPEARVQSPALYSLGLATHVCHPSSREARAAGSGVQGQPPIHKEFEEQKPTQCPPLRGQE